MSRKEIHENFLQAFKEKAMQEKGEINKELVNRFGSVPADELDKIGNQIMNLDVDLLLEFHTIDGHTFNVKDDEDMEELVENIKNDGQLLPIIIRKDNRKLGFYEILSGHRRVHALKRLGIKTAKCIVVDYDDDTAIQTMVTSNLVSRKKISVMERAKSYKAYREACFRKHGNIKDTLEEIQNYSGDSSITIRRYIKLNDLIPELQTRVNDSEISIKSGALLSELEEVQQKKVNQLIDVGLKVNEEAAKQIKFDFQNDDGKMVDRELRRKEKEKDTKKELLEEEKRKVDEMAPEEQKDFLRKKAKEMLKEEVDKKRSICFRDLKDVLPDELSLKTKNEQWKYVYDILSKYQENEQG